MTDKFYEDPTERVHDLAETLSTSGWEMIALPQLARRVQRLEGQIAMGRSKSLEELRFLQGCHKALSEIVADPKKFFLGGSKDRPAEEASD